MKKFFVVLVGVGFDSQVTFSSYSGRNLKDVLYQISLSEEGGLFSQVANMSEDDFSWDSTSETWVKFEEEISIYISENEVKCYKTVIENEL